VIVDDNGDYTPLGLAEQLADAGHQVTIATPHPAVGRRLGPDSTVDLAWVYPRLVHAGVGIITGVYVQRVETRQAVIADVHDNRRRTIDVDTVILCMLRSADDGLYQDLRASGLDVRRIGDCVAPREVDDALLDGVREGNEV
jgi:NADPH-dependent 2,4-dienoyl-CoA reductase/sulfur reductase-like enzyme